MTVPVGKCGISTYLALCRRWGKFIGPVTDRDLILPYRGTSRAVGLLVLALVGLHMEAPRIGGQPVPLNDSSLWGYHVYLMCLAVCRYSGCKTNRQFERSMI